MTDRPPCLPIVSERLHLRRLRRSDAAAMFVYRNDPTVVRFQGWKPTEVAALENFIAEQQDLQFGLSGTWFQLAIVLAEQNQLIGDLGMHFLADAPQQVELGITLSPSFQGEGYATEAMVEAFGFLFYGLGKHRVIASMDPRNLASITLVEALDMRREAHFKRNYAAGDEWCDTLVYALLAEEWRGKTI
jgi:RimJ/RimL family protein N-acetyltransferase